MGAGLEATFASTTKRERRTALASTLKTEPELANFDTRACLCCDVQFRVFPAHFNHERFGENLRMFRAARAVLKLA